MKDPTLNEWIFTFTHLGFGVSFVRDMGISGSPVRITIENAGKGLVTVLDAEFFAENSFHLQRHLNFMYKELMREK